ncbi:MAG: hypothetical protein H7Z14_01685 [Anaerolineae bacterium]|nr:hypothetical protein [Phycisphaerae bacterium]
MRAQRFLIGSIVLLFSASASADFKSESLPRKWLNPLLPEDLPALKHPTYFKPLDKARLESFTGRYKRSLMTLWELKDADATEVALIKARSLAVIGRTPEAIEILSDAKLKDESRVQVLLACILSDTGKHTDAIAMLRANLEKHTDSIPTRYHLARILERTGDMTAALGAYTWFVQGENAPFIRWQKDQEVAFESAEDVVFIGRAADRWASMTSAYKQKPELHDAIYNTFVRAYDVIDRDYWPAHVAAAEFALSHDNTDGAVEELQAVEEKNPNDVRSLELYGQITLSGFKFDACDETILAIRRIDPTSSIADVLEARNFLAQRRPADAIKPLERVLTRQPDHIEAIGVLAAAYALQLKDEKTAELLQRVDELDVGHDNATAYYDVAEQLGAMRQYPRAAKMYQVAIERAPWWTEPRNSLGLLYTQSGDEDLAQATLDAAHNLDPYNLRTTNYLRLLEDLAKFARKETAHFIVMYDSKEDPVIPEYFSDYLESIHAAVAADYKTTPAQKTMIEVFPTHDAFSVRTTGSPWIGTVGASTGRVIALVSPRKGEATFGPFNWAQVLRHEYTHTVTLAATDNRIPHWMTEGLAVYQEHSPLRWDWVPMLYRAVTKDELFTLENLTWGFVRPRRPIDRQLAYAQSFWICSYIEEKYGHDAILKMLDGFRAGKSTEEVFPEVLQRSPTEFTQDFFKWCRAQVASWGYDEGTSKKYEELRKRGEDLIKAKKYADAVAVWEEIITIRPVDALPHQRLAGLYLSKEVNDKVKAIAHLKALHDVELKDNRYAKRIAGIYRDMNNLPEAQAMAMQAVFIDPYDLGAHKLLAEFADKANDAPTVARERKVIEILEKRKSN